MLTLEEIKNQYDDTFHKFERGLLREYLQYQLLDLIFRHKVGRKLSFLGGTCLRIVYNNKRFSEDLDFDNKNLTIEEFNTLIKHIQKELERLGFLTETRIVHQKAFRCYLKFPKLLYEYGLSPLENEKILIQLDSFDQGVNYPTKLHIINKFDILKQIIITPKDVILAQKLWTITQRKRAKGRDFYDVIFLLQNTKPNIDFLRAKFGTNDKKEIKRILLDNIENLNWTKITKDVEPFLLNKKEAEKIKLFPELLNQTEF
jgi:predicted nucleotidyltransferase component of viral defense system